MGTEIEAQREVVRAWLARSEPSRNNDSRNKVQAAESLTKVEGSGSVSPGDKPSVSSVSAAAVHVPPVPPSASSTVLEAEITRAELTGDRLS
jgi:hypothetical protein